MWLAEGGGRSTADDERAERVREAVRAAWKREVDEINDFMSGMPLRYLFGTAPETIAAHAQIASGRADADVALGEVPSQHPDVIELCVVADDRPGLLSRIAAALTASRLEVLAAQVYSRRKPNGNEAVDLFWVRDCTPDAAERRVARLHADLSDLLSEKIKPEALLRARTGSDSPWRERPSPAVVPEVIIDDRASPTHSVIEVFAKDRPGLLYTLGKTLHELGLSIALSKINTEGTRVADVFYVAELSGEKITRHRAHPRHSRSASRGHHDLKRSILSRAMVLSPRSVCLVSLFLVSACGPSTPASETPKTDPSGPLTPTNTHTSSMEEGPVPQGSPEVTKGAKLLESGDLPGAKASFKAALAKNPKDAEAHCGLGEVADKEKDRATAETEYKAAFDARPDLECAATNLAAIYVETKKYDEAITVAKAGAAKHPKNAMLQLNMAMAYGAKGDEAGATKAFDTAVSLAPNDAGILIAYGEWLGQMKKTDQAVAKLRLARPLAKDDPAILSGIAISLRSVGAFSGLRAHARQGDLDQGWCRVPIGTCTMQTRVEGRKGRNGRPRGGRQSRRKLSPSSLLSWWSLRHRGKLQRRTT